MHTINLRPQALAFHRRLPQPLSTFLQASGISEEVIHRRMIGWHEEHFTLPVFTLNREVSCFLLLDPVDLSVTGTLPHSEVALYGAEVLANSPEEVVVVGSVLDRLILESHGFSAVALLSKLAAPLLQSVPTLYACTLPLHLALLLPQAKKVPIPGTVEDFFVASARSATDFLILLNQAS